MPITIIVRHGVGHDTRLTFDGTQRVVIGRGPGSDVRLPDTSVSHRHATLRGQGSEFALVDEGSTNGTFVGDVRIAARTSRLVRSGDTVRVGRIVLELRIDQSPVTRDVAAATRDLALAMVSQAMAAMGADRAPKVRVVEGRDQGSTIALTQDEHPYVIGRAPHCDLVLEDPDSSREHLCVISRGGAVFLRDRAAKNGTFLGEVRLTDDREVQWRPAIMCASVARSWPSRSRSVTRSRISSAPRTNRSRSTAHARTRPRRPMRSAPRRPQQAQRPLKPRWRPSRQRRYQRPSDGFAGR